MSKDNMLAVVEGMGVSAYLRSESLMNRFEQLLGGNEEASAYVQQVLLTVSADEKLMKCSVVSIARAALMAGSRRLSVVPSDRQAYLVSVWNKKKGELEAELWTHYRGEYTLMMRTGLYDAVDVVAVYGDEQCQKDLHTGLHVIFKDGKPVRFRNESAGWERSTIQGYMGYYIRKDGTRKTVYWTLNELEEYAREYSKPYQNDIANGTKNSGWSDDGHTRQIFEMKTVLRDLAGWGEKSVGKGLAAPRPVDYDVIDAEIVNDLPKPALPSAKQMDREHAENVDIAFPPYVEQGYEYRSPEAIRAFSLGSGMDAVDSAKKLGALYKERTVERFMTEADWHLAGSTIMRE